MVIRPTPSNTLSFLPVVNSALYADDHKEQRMQNMALTLSALSTVVHAGARVPLHANFVRHYPPHEPS